MSPFLGESEDDRPWSALPDLGSEVPGLLLHAIVFVYVIHYAIRRSRKILDPLLDGFIAPLDAWIDRIFWSKKLADYRGYRHTLASQASVVCATVEELGWPCYSCLVIRAKNNCGGVEIELIRASTSSSPSQIHYLARQISPAFTHFSLSSQEKQSLLSGSGVFSSPRLSALFISPHCPPSADLIFCKKIGVSEGGEHFLLIVSKETSAEGGDAANRAAPLTRAQSSIMDINNSIENYWGR